METRHPIKGHFGSEFLAICNHCTVMTAWSRKTWKFCEQFLHFLGEKRPFTVKFSTLCLESFHCLTDGRWCVEISWNLSDGKLAKSCFIYRTNKTNKISAASQTVVSACIAPKICHGQPPTMFTQCSIFYRNRFTFVGVVRVNTGVCSIDYFHNSPEAMLRFGRIISIIGSG